MAADPAVLHQLREHLRPVTLAAERSLPVPSAFQSLLPAGLPRGAVVRVGGPGATSLSLALAAGPSGAGSWVAMVGLPEMGWAAAAELGVDLSRTAHVREPEPARWPTVVAALVDAFDVVLIAPRHRVAATDARRLLARARERGALLLESRPAWPEAPAVTLRVRSCRWDGLGEGWGRLEARRVTVEVEGRRGAGGRPRRAELWMPGPEGVSACREPSAPLRGPW